MSNTGVEYILSLKDLMSSGIRNATGETNKLNSSMNLAQNSANVLQKAIAGIGVGLGIREIVNTTASIEGLQNQLNFASGSAEQGARDFEWIREKANYLGLDLQTAAQSFAKFSGAARNTSLEGQGVRDVFEGVGMAATVMHLSADEANGTFTALQQMLSKGKVSAEELNGQLGERLPGALGIASRAMGVTQAELMKMMQNGQLLSEEFLPKFAAQLKTEFAGGVDEARQSLSANLNRMNNAFLELKITIGELLMPVIIGSIQLIRSFTNFVRDHAVAISFLVGSFTAVAGAIFVYNSYMKIAAIYSGAKFIWGLWSLAAALDGVTVAQWLLNTATAFFAGLSGVGLFAVAAAGAAALATGIMAAKYAYDKLNKSAESGVGAASNAMKPIPPTNGSPTTKPPTTKPPTATASKGGTSTSVVESRGVQNFNIDINKLVETIQVSTTNLTEGAAQIKSAVAQALIEAVNDFQLMATK